MAEKYKSSTGSARQSSSDWPLIVAAGVLFHLAPLLLALVAVIQSPLAPLLVWWNL